ncbi:MAG TPA: hypothetical protein VND67_02455 [Acidimicrobiales bacterium]|nr:hypothetical protein [Acidimicrobiales bacterium]
MAGPAAPADRVAPLVADASLSTCLNLDWFFAKLRRDAAGGYRTGAEGVDRSLPKDDFRR